MVNNKSGFPTWLGIVLIIVIAYLAFFAKPKSDETQEVTLGGQDECTTTDDCPYGHICTTAFVCVTTPCDAPMVCRYQGPGGQCDNDNDCPKGLTCTGTKPCDHPEYCIRLYGKPTYTVCE